ncbi:LysR family transcriptional regulator [Celeribacter neptunius]|uniref:DNA-binding transcriptional regulator, LysR family n=1 Tax=Celeribacter neptunius TaxID=588602 RepID=A0A1I3V6L8_9RHOB|nr:LysR family transcriptional regulator [Celeribacter neptunius]SFJ90790.1 DNA-binding transcriptional regulator, LysR family [Celeribacter neptunius]
MNKVTDPMATDFRALDVLLRVYRLGSFTRAAEDLEMNQSVVSYTIDKLRGVFDDPLFVREARRLIATPRCEEVVTEAAELLERFSQLTATQDFDPKQSTETVTIACNYYERELIIPHLIHAIRAEAPKLRIEIVDSSYLGHDKLLRMEADLLIGPFVQLGAAFYARALYDDHYVCMMDPAHPMAKAALSMEEYLPLDHVYITYGGKWKSRYMQELERQGHEISIAIRTPSPAGIQTLIAGSELVATVPERLSRKLGQGLHIARCPVPTPVQIQMVWTARTHRSQMHQWVRDLVVRATRGV